VLVGALRTAGFFELPAEDLERRRFGLFLFPRPGVSQNHISKSPPRRRSPRSPAEDRIERIHRLCETRAVPDIPDRHAIERSAVDIRPGWYAQTGQ
jgi:hypothetical protein